MPSQRQIDALERAVLAIGGRPLDHPCRSIEIPGVAAGEKVHPDAHAAMQDVHTAYTEGCGGVARFEVPYEPDEDAQTHGRAIVCARCDAADRFPRLQGY